MGACFAPVTCYHHDVNVHLVQIPGQQRHSGYPITLITPVIHHYKSCASGADGMQHIIHISTFWFLAFEVVVQVDLN